MFKSIIYLALFIFSTNGVDCSTRILTNCESDVQCKWQQGNGQCLKLDSTDCTTTGYCAQGCTVTPAVFATCSDPKIATCSSETTAETCSGDCTWSTGTCKGGPFGCESQGTGTCGEAPGCFVNISRKCEAIPDDESYCSQFGVNNFTECELVEGCKISGTSCISDGEEANPICKYFSATRRASECSSATEDYFCKVEGSSCVINSGLFDEFSEEYQYYRSLATEWCPTLKTTAATACEIYNCKISGTECTSKTPDEICNEYSLALTVSECSNGVDECCAVNGANCITKPGLNPAESEWCAELETSCEARSTAATGSQCTDHYPCVVKGEQCVRDRFDCTIGVKADGSCTDEASDHGCSSETTLECVGRDCGVITSEGNCQLECEWGGEIGNCVPVTPLNCVLDNEKGCDTINGDSCASSPFVPAACSVPSIGESTCTAQTSNTGCEGTNGCKWRTGGGSCVAADTNPSGDDDDDNNSTGGDDDDDKSTGGDDDDDNSTVGDDDSNASIICSHFVFMILVILLLI